MNTNDFLEQVEDAWNKIEWADTPKNERFDKLCEAVDQMYDQNEYSAYVRIFYDCDYRSEEMAEELLDLGQRFDIVCHKVFYTDDCDTIIVVLHHRIPKGV